MGYDSAFELYRDSDPALVDELRAALLNGNELTCHYQPKINADDGSVHSVEALLRWQHPSRGMLLPEEFLPAAERAGLMRRVANRTLDLALAQLRSWREQGMNLTVAVNLSTTNLLDLDLEGTIEGLLTAHGLPADALIIEITESTLADSVRSRNTVATLQHLGVRISLDDYGTGWSSLARLQDVSVDELKLDRVFVARLAQDPRSVAIVRSTVALAHSLGANLVAEGVEDEVTLSALRRYGCTITQGFVHSPPLPADDAGAVDQQSRAGSGLTSALVGSAAAQQRVRHRGTTRGRCSDRREPAGLSGIVLVTGPSVASSPWATSRTIWSRASCGVPANDDTTGTSLQWAAYLPCPGDQTTQ
ncbi:EAL domain-containing protein [Mycobacterium ostraviense]|uniref:EAL domain-containing protein n=1 Tax=Mycobacterium ostraviense TaxID=2738409 RepID=UPI001E2982D6|nr:EAL domain-containing protein [Mycobacterium ostraviense]UGT94189.1 EAL domain-containing protein [Mycobacterium ostraviense]